MTHHFKGRVSPSSVIHDEIDFSLIEIGVISFNLEDLNKYENKEELKIK